MKSIHKPGRPEKKMEPAFCEILLQQYQTLTTRQLANIYNVSQPTICNWLRKARNEEDTTNEQNRHRQDAAAKSV